MIVAFLNTKAIKESRLAFLENIEKIENIEISNIELYRGRMVTKRNNISILQIKWSRGVRKTFRPSFHKRVRSSSSSYVKSKVLLWLLLLCFDVFLNVWCLPWVASEDIPSYRSYLQLSRAMNSLNNWNLTWYLWSIIMRSGVS